MADAASYAALCDQVYRRGAADQALEVLSLSESRAAP